ncbi:MAG: helix-turn-helix domain-containing protein [Bacteroidales bacterium]|nr:helix-turn-helix domain-containing protein [Bacteroidales bacterium]
MRVNITRAREKSGFTQKAVAESLGISRTAYSKIEKGPTKILGRRIGKIAEVLGVSLDELLLGYIPDPDSAGRLEQERADYGLKKASLVAGYEEKLEAGSREKAALMALVESLKETIRNQEDIIAMLRRRIPEEND